MGWGSGFHGGSSSNSHVRMPRIEFPKFDGDNPRWWNEKCEKYFDMYSVPSHSWANFTTMHFTGTAAFMVANL
uniref:Uncharacterized protein n=1 Tax=Arundo donax TaxID=35708 RepID=A0A0A8ZUC4_ARUDO